MSARKRKPLGAALKAARDDSPRQSAATSPPVKTAEEANPPMSAEPVQTAASSKPPSREGKKFVGAYFSPEVSTQLKILSAKSGQTNQDLLGEALNLLFVHYGENPIAEDGRSKKG